MHKEDMKMARYNRAYVCGIVSMSQGSPRNFRVLLEEEIVTNDGQKFSYKKFNVTEPELVTFYRKYKSLCVNFTVTVGGGIKTTQGDSSRYDLNRCGVTRIILGEIRNFDNKDELLGYRLADSNGNTRRMLLKDCIAIGTEVKKRNEVPFANAQFVNQDGKKAFYRSYMTDGFPKEYIKIQRKNTHAKETVVDKKENEKAVKKIEDLFTKEQILELKKAKKSGVDIRIIGNAKLSPEQMRSIRIAEAEGLKARRYADPAYKVENMEFMRVEMETGGDISYMLNHNYNTEQLFELSRAYEYGVDISKVANPKLSADEMSRLVDDLSKEIWTDYKVIEGGNKIKI